MRKVDVLLNRVEEILRHLNTSVIKIVLLDLISVFITHAQLSDHNPVSLREFAF